MQKFGLSVAVGNTESDHRDGWQHTTGQIFIVPECMRTVGRGGQICKKFKRDAVREYTAWTYTSYEWWCREIIIIEPRFGQPMRAVLASPFPGTAGTAKIFLSQTCRALRGKLRSSPAGRCRASVRHFFSPFRILGAGGRAGGGGTGGGTEGARLRFYGGIKSERDPRRLLRLFSSFFEIIFDELVRSYFIFFPF